MSLTKRWLEKISEQMGLEGEITDAVMEEARRRRERIAEKCSTCLVLRPQPTTQVPRPGGRGPRPVANDNF